MHLSHSFLSPLHRQGEPCDSLYSSARKKNLDSYSTLLGIMRSRGSHSTILGTACKTPKQVSNQRDWITSFYPGILGRDLHSVRNHTSIVPDPPAGRAGGGLVQLVSSQGWAEWWVLTAQTLPLLVTESGDLWKQDLDLFQQAWTYIGLW